MKPRRRREKPSSRRTPKRKPKPKPRPAPKGTKRAKHPARTKRPLQKKRTKRSNRQTVDALERQVRRLGLARGKLERRLTAAVQEIGTLRQFEIRAQVLQAELARRDAEIEQLRREREERLRAFESRLGAAPTPS